MEPLPRDTDCTTTIAVGERLVIAPSSVSAAYPSAIRAGFVVALLVLACVIAYMDVQVFALLVTPMKAAFGISDARVGMLQGLAFNLCNGLAAFPYGLLIDRHNRLRLLSYSAMGWSGFTILSGLSTHFWELFGCRIGVGLAESGLYIAAYSLIADLYPPRSRPNAVFAFFAAVLLGGSIAIYLGGVTIDFIDTYVRQSWMALRAVPTWRLTYFAAAMPGIVLAALFLLGHEPARQTHEGDVARDAEEHDLGAFLKNNVATVSCLLGYSLIGSIGFNSLFFWMPTILTRIFGYSAAQSGESVGVAFGVASISGVVFAAVSVRLLNHRHGDLAPLQASRLGAVAAGLALPGVYLAQTPLQILGIWMVFTVPYYVVSSIGPSLINTITPNHLRGRVIAIYTVSSVIADIVSPPIVGTLSDQVFHGPRGLLLACLAPGVPCCLVGAVLYGVLTKPFRRTLEFPFGMNAAADG